MSVTRGTGLLEPLLARLRARQANIIIPDSIRDGRILDIGCGSEPYFLAHTSFREKYAIDQLPASPNQSNIFFHTIDVNNDPKLPFESKYFQAITMLAVVEHLNPSILVDLLKECYRTLCPGGLIILTTPAAWSDSLLRLMAKLRLVSKEEIDEHVFAYTLPLLGWYFGAAGFPMQSIRFGYFEFWLNMWATAKR